MIYVAALGMLALTAILQGLVWGLPRLARAFTRCPHCRRAVPVRRPRCRHCGQQVVSGRPPSRTLRLRREG